MFRGALLFACALGCAREAKVAPAAPEPPIKSGVYKLSVATSHELSCSVSYERHEDDAAYELTIRDDNTATLTVVLRTSRMFGPSSEKFSLANKPYKRRTLRYVGRANHGSTFEGAEEHSAASARLACRPANIALNDPGKSRVDVISCSGLPWLPERGAKFFAGPAPLASGAGVLLAVEDYGGGEPEVTLRRGL